MRTASCPDFRQLLEENTLNAHTMFYRRYLGPRKTRTPENTPSRPARADGRVFYRDQPEARARINEKVHADALVWISSVKIGPDGDIPIREDESGPS